jgi:hypothetical protein
MLVLEHVRLAGNTPEHQAKAACPALRVEPPDMSGSWLRTSLGIRNIALPVNQTEETVDVARLQTAALVTGV